MSDFDIEEEGYNACRNSVAATKLKGHSLIRFTGEDHLVFLQGQTTNDILALEDGQGQQTAILDPKARVRTLASVFRCKDCIYMMLPDETCEAVMDHLNKYIVMDDVEIEKLDFSLLCFSGPEAKTSLRKDLKRK